MKGIGEAEMVAERVEMKSAMSPNSSPSLFRSITSPTLNSISSHNWEISEEPEREVKSFCKEGLRVKEVTNIS